jgi:hypothetical protein
MVKVRFDGTGDLKLWSWRLMLISLDLKQLIKQCFLYFRLFEYGRCDPDRLSCPFCTTIRKWV